MSYDFINSPSRGVTPTHNLAVKHPDVAKRWSTKNPVSPLEVTPSSNKRAWWVCDEGHEYDATITKASNGRGCPYCSGRKVLIGYNDFATIYPDIAKELDDARNDGITGYDIASGSNVRLWFKCDNGHEAYSLVKKRVQSKGCPKCKTPVKRGALSEEHPDISKQWDTEKNGNLSPEDVTSGSKKTVWWICDKGHSYDTSVVEKVRGGSSMCPVCRGRRVIPGVNDLATIRPDLAKEWDSGKNKNSPHEVAYKSMRNAHWKCSQGHTWEALINRRAYGEGCPYCANKRVFKGGNDLATTHPDVAEEWDFERNTLTPQEVTAGSNVVVGWVCKKGHRYERSPKSRTGHAKTGCSYCTGRKLLEGFNDLATTHAELVEKHWDVEKNSDTAPQSVTYGMSKKVWWKCDEGHSFLMPINSKVLRESLCPRCSSSAGEKELADFVIELLGEDKVRTSVRNVIAPYELDIYVPSLGVAIEFNGVYWHRETEKRDKNYHYNKWKMCADQDVQLITIWEDEWRDKQEIVKSMISHKLGADRNQKVFARNTAVVEVDSSLARGFLDLNHIQGCSSGSSYIGLQDGNGDLIAVSVWRKNKHDFYLDRYATSCTVVGGMGKLLKQGIEKAKENECNAIVTFADHQVSDGGLYETLGFSRDRDLPPDYKYLDKGERKHKFGYRLKRFRNDPDLEYHEGLTESQLAELNDLDRVWDCGKTRFVLEI